MSINSKEAYIQCYVHVIGLHLTPVKYELKIVGLISEGYALL